MRAQIWECWETGTGREGDAGGKQPSLVQQKSFYLEITAQWFLLPRVSAQVERVSDIQPSRLPGLTVVTKGLKCSSPKLRCVLCAKHLLGFPALIRKEEWKFPTNTASVHTYWNNNNDALDEVKCTLNSPFCFFFTMITRNLKIPICWGKNLKKKKEKQIYVFV